MINCFDVIKGPPQASALTPFSFQVVPSVFASFSLSPKRRGTSVESSQRTSGAWDVGWTEHVVFDFPGHAAPGQIRTAVSFLGFGHLFRGVILALLTRKKQAELSFWEGSERGWVRASAFSEYFPRLWVVSTHGWARGQSSLFDTVAQTRSPS